jgi:flagellar biosynthetic protein FliR
VSLLSEITPLLPGLALATSRALGLIAMLPFSSIPQVAVLRLSFSLGLALAFGPALFSDDASAADSRGESQALGSDISLLCLIGEFLVGAALGLPAALVVNAASMWAEIVDGVRGQTVASFYDPLTERQETGFVTLVRSLVLASVLVLGLGEALVEGYARSFDSFPLGALSLFGLREGAMQAMNSVLMSLDAVTTAVFPLAVIGASIEVALALLAKFLPQGSFSHESFLLKSAALFIAALTWWRLGLEQSLLRASLPQLQ